MPVLAQEHSIDIQPTKIEVSSNARTASIALTNNGTADKLYQATMFSWNQNDNQDQLVPSNDIIVFPPVVTIAAGTTKIFRFGIKPASSINNRERSYRLMLQEIPSKVNINSGVQFSYNFSVPIFIASLGKVTNDLKWTASLNSNHRNLTLILNNNGSVHVLVEKINIFSDFAGTALLSRLVVSSDVLAGTKRVFNFELPQPLVTNAVSGELVLDNGKVLKFLVPVTS